jgi:predicted TIM-barrel fold metal-dependent hydrolase
VTGTPAVPKRIDMHAHVGLLGDRWPHWGKLSAYYKQQLTYRVFLLYARIPEDMVSDRLLRERTEETLSECGLDHVVCLALDPPYDDSGARREDRAHVWVDNDYVLALRQTLGPKVLLGASVHPYDPRFEERVRRLVDSGAVLLKWLPSAQNIRLADPRVRKALQVLAHANGPGKPLPLLLHVGAEYAIPPYDPRIASYDFLSWSVWDRLRNQLRPRRSRLQTPEVAAVHATIAEAIDAGAVIIMAHVGAPYFASGVLGGMVEHSDFRAVSAWLQRPPSQAGGRCYADVSAFATPFRRTYFKDVARLPKDRLVYGSDFPTPVFELSADLGEMLSDFRAILDGRLERVLVPQDNLLDVHERELRFAFGAHPMFTNFASLTDLA